MNRKHTAEEYLEIIDRFRKLKSEIEFSARDAGIYFWITVSKHWMKEVNGRSSVKSEIYIFAESYLEKFISHSEQNNIPYENCNIKLKANDLPGLSHKPLFDYFKDTKTAFRVLLLIMLQEKMVLALYTLLLDLVRKILPLPKP